MAYIEKCNCSRKINSHDQPTNPDRQSQSRNLNSNGIENTFDSISKLTTETPTGVNRETASLPSAEDNILGTNIFNFYTPTIHEGPEFGFQLQREVDFWDAISHSPSSYLSNTNASVDLSALDTIPAGTDWYQDPSISANEDTWSFHDI